MLTEIQALVDANVASVISSSIGFSEPNISLADVQGFDTAFAQAAAQGQTFLSAQGDSGSDDIDFGSAQGTHGLNIDYPGSNPLVLSIGGTDFQDLYDSDVKGTPQSTYWGPTNSPFYGDALGYVPETTWNDSCASTIRAVDPVQGGAPGETIATYCNGNLGKQTGGGGGGGISTLYAQPSWQTGIPGLSSTITNRATPDVSLFSAGGGLWNHAIVVCDSCGGEPCTSPDTFGYAGGTSFAAPMFAGIIGLLDTATGSRQGLVQPALYALARAQYAAGTACYANGQAINTGATNGLPASTCIFHDVTTSGNDNECEAGTPDCFTNAGASYGVMTSSGNTSTFVDAYAAGVGYDIATGLGSVNVTNLINKWSTAFSSSTALTATPNAITTAQSTTLKATVTGGTPAHYSSEVPAVTGMVSFAAGSTALGSCTLASGTCSLSVAGTKFAIGANSVKATYATNGTYPSSTSTAATVTVSAAAKTAQTITFGALAGKVYGAAPFALTATASSGLAVTYTVTGPASISGSTLSITGAGSVSVTASQAGNATYAAATPVVQSFTVTKAVLTAKATNATRPQGAANPTLAYTTAGYVNGDSSSVVGGTATLTTTATTASAAGSYPITFATGNLTATNYTFTYVAGTLTVTAPTDTTAPTVTLTGTAAGPPKQVIFSSQDNGGGSGLATVTVTNCTNCSFTTTSFTRGTLSAVTTTASKTNQALSSSVTIVATDVAGNATTFDPVDLQLESKGRPTEHRIRIDGKENKILISNGKPGMSWMRFVVNGRILPQVKLSDGQSAALNISRYLRPGRYNQVLIIADGKVDASSWIIFTQP